MADAPRRRNVDDSGSGGAMAAELRYTTNLSCLSATVGDGTGGPILAREVADQPFVRLAQGGVER